MSQYVCVRIPRMDNVNIALFDYDRNNTLYFFILNADEHIYMRYGGRDSASQDSYLNLDSLELALKKGLELHKRYQAGEIKRNELPKPVYPKEIPLLVERTFARGNCVECHLIGDYQNLHREKDGTLNKVEHLYRSPDLKTIGIHLDVPKGLVVGEAKGAAAAAGMKPGDLITKLNGKQVLTFGDLQYVYGYVPRNSVSVDMTVEREGKPVELSIALPVRWWWNDVRYRQSSVDPRVYFESRPLSEDDKKKHGLDPKGFASEVTHVDALAQMMKSHDLKVGDIVYAVDGVKTDEYAHTADLYIKLHKTPGDVVKVDVIREGKQMQMPVQTYRMSFRK